MSFQESDKTNVVIAAFTSCQARLKLHDVLEKLGDRALYYDTDSVVFVTNTSKNQVVKQVKPKLGNFLGELTSELPEDTYIKKFISAGPKNYSYILDKPCPKTGKDTFCKVKGISLNYRTSKIVNCSTMEQFVRSPSDDNVVSVPEPDKIIRNLKLGTLESKDRKKDYRVVYTKRVIKEDFNTVPYGY